MGEVWTPGIDLRSYCQRLDTGGWPHGPGWSGDSGDGKNESNKVHLGVRADRIIGYEARGKDFWFW